MRGHLKLLRVISSAIKDHVSAATTVIGFAALLLSATWWLVEPRVMAHVGPVLELPAAVNDIGRRVTALERSVNEARRTRPVAEYDRTRSFVVDGCRIGAVCRGQFRFRRTADGLSCGPPTVTPFVSNHYGVTRVVSAYEGPVVRGREDWLVAPFRFTPPDGTQSGLAEFWLSLNYTGCAHPRDVRKEQSFVLTFTAHPAAAEPKSRDF